MASTQHVLLSPAELAYLHDSLSLRPPIRPDGRAPTQFRPLTAETDMLPGTNGSARICFADGTEAMVGIKAEVARTEERPDAVATAHTAGKGDGEDEDEDEDNPMQGIETDPGNGARRGDGDWVEMTVEIPGYRDDDAGTVFLAAMLSEALLADGEFVKKLSINSRFHWKLYLDILLISPPLSYPLPLLSLTTHLALLAARLPRLRSEGEEDPLFDDDWAAAPYLYARKGGRATSRPPVTLLVTAVGHNILFDPSQEELAVADVALAVSVGEETTAGKGVHREDQPGRRLRLLAIRTVDPPSRLTAPGVANADNMAYGLAPATAKQQQPVVARTADTAETEAVEGVWRPPRGGAKALVMAALVEKVLETGGVADEILDALDAVDLG